MTYLIYLIILFYPAYALAMEAHYVKRVVDGDTLLLDSKHLVRYIGINAPETRHGKLMAEPFGIEAKNQHARFVGEGDKIYLEYDIEKSDRYGRKLAYVHTREKIFINRMMLEQGWAYCLSKAPNLRYQDVFLQAQHLAMQGKQGMWHGWKAQALNIVGNKRSRRFHRESCSFGLRTAKSNRIAFYSLWDAFWEGYAPCKKCFPKGPFVVQAD